MTVISQFCEFMRDFCSRQAINSRCLDLWPSLQILAGLMTALCGSWFGCEPNFEQNLE